MKYLLDTHIWLWSLLTPEKLNSAITLLFENKENHFFISPITVWETLILAQKGRIELNLPPDEWINEAIKITLVQEAKLSHRIAIKSRFINLPHQDPADRFIAATAWEYDLILVTEDKLLNQSKQVKLFKKDS